MHSIAIDFSTGEISLGIEGRVTDLVEQARPTPDAKEWTVHLGEALLDDVVVCVTAGRAPLLVRVGLTPPNNLGFLEQDQCAGAITRAILRLGANSWRAHPDGYFKWGRVNLLSEWRDGGWGAFFSVIQRA